MKILFEKNAPTEKRWAHTQFQRVLKYIETCIIHPDTTWKHSEYSPFIIFGWSQTITRNIAIFQRSKQNADWIFPMANYSPVPLQQFSQDFCKLSEIKCFSCRFGRKCSSNLVSCRIPKRGQKLESFAGYDSAPILSCVLKLIRIHQTSLPYIDCRNNPNSALWHSSVVVDVFGSYTTTETALVFSFYAGMGTKNNWNTLSIILRF